MYASAYAAVGWKVTGFDPAEVATPEGIERSASAEAAAEGADLVLGLTTAKHASAAAEAAAHALPAEAIYIDLNASSPELKVELAGLIGSDRFVDGAVIGSVKKFGPQVRVLLAGPAAARAAEALVVINADAQPISDEVGAASRRKLLRSVFMKGLGALISESMHAGEVAGEIEWMREQISAALVDGEVALDRLNDGTRIHAARRSTELGDALNLLEGYVGQWPVTRGAQARHLELARDGAADLAERLSKVPTAALGDGSDRLGLAHSSIKPVWPSPPIAGRAFTVLVNSGDNQAVHSALRQAQPGDVLVVAGGGNTERALMGELIAARAQNAGIRGFITDGAIRDVSALQESGFPVWAAGVSPAGPYKHGPGRLGETVAVGGAVCAHGDYVVADEDGVIFLPAVRAEAMLSAGEAVLADEEHRRKIIRSTN